MKKTFKKAGALLLLGMMAFSASACGKTKKEPVPNTPTDIEIMMWDAGNGTAYMEKIADAFEAKFPQYTVYIEPTTDSGFIDSKLQTLDPELNSTDILMSITSGHIKKNSVNLDDVINSTATGDSKTIKEKMGSYAEFLAYDDGHYYEIPFSGGWQGIVYNADIINGSDYKVPNTTNELINLVNELVADNKVPFIHFSPAGYWDELLNVWMAQYSTVESVWDMYKNPTLAKLTSGDNGYIQGLSVLEQCINDVKKNYSGSNSLSYTDAQTLFLEGSAVMMANGSWIEYEMKGNYQPGEKNILMMKTPIVSAIRDKCNSIETDEELSYLIQAIDRGKTDLSGTGYSVTQEDYDRIAKARKIAYNNASGHSACIPNCSNAVEGAKEFLRFFLSDEGMQIYASELQQLLPFNFSQDVSLDTSSWTPLAKKVYEMNTAGFIGIQEAPKSRHPIFDAGASINAGLSPALLLSATNPADRLTASQFVQRVNTDINKKWKDWWENAGLVAP